MDEKREKMRRIMFDVAGIEWSGRYFNNKQGADTR